MAIERKLKIVFGALAVVLLAIFVLQGISRQSQLESRRWVTHTRDVIAELSWLRPKVIDAEAAARGYVLSQDKQYSVLLDDVSAEVDRHLDTLERLIDDNPGQRQRMAQLRDMVRTRREIGQKMMELRDSAGAAAAAEAFTASHARTSVDALRALLAAMDQEEQRLLEVRRERALANDNASANGSIGLAVVVVGLLVTAYLIFRREEKHREVLEQDLRRTNQELQDASRLKSEFLAHMSHELRTPLNAVIGYTGTLLMKLPGPLTADQERQLKTIQTSSRHLLSLINDVLDLARIESGKVEVELKVLGCQEIMEEVMATLRPLAQSKNLALEADFPEAPVQVRTDLRAFSQILINLANNAIKFTEKGSVKLRLRERDGEGLAAIDVIDTGVGVRSEEQAKLFRAFQQLQAGKPGREGTGLGLYLSGRLAELIQGRIEFESEYGQGSRFTLLIPKA